MKHLLVLVAASVAIAVSPSVAIAASQRSTLTPGVTRTVAVPLEANRAAEVLVSAPKPGAFAADASVVVTIADPAGRTVEKSLHAGDADLYIVLRSAVAGKSPVTLVSKNFTGDIDVAVTNTRAGATALAAGLNTDWRRAELMELGRTIYASGDDRPYIPRLGTPGETFDQMTAGVHWYRFDHKGPAEILVHFQLDVLDRDVPVDLAVFRMESGQPVAYTRGRERFEPEKSTNFHGLYKFAPRVIAPGTYLVRVMANHPAYQLQTDVYPAPPYTNPRQAVRTAMDYILRKGDSWHANVPRRGAVVLRTSNTLQETRLCIACHPTHFSTRGALVAVENGYPVRARTSLQFLVERLYNNPRPLYGKNDASWARMIHAPGNVLSRLSYLVDKFEREIGGERREELHRGVAKYLEMYWPGMTAPGHESNGNLPRISGFEVALHNALFFQDLHKRTGDEKYAALRKQIEEIVVSGVPDDNLDLAWKLDALVTLGRDKHAAAIRTLVEEIFKRQQKDGTWPMPFEMEDIQYDFGRQQVTRRKLPLLPGQEGPRASDFQTYHTIYALARAGVTIDDPRLKKAVDLCLSRQTPSGAWQGRPDYKNFDTPFRDTQYAIMALSTLFPGPKGAHGWNAGFAAPPSNFDENDAAGAVVALDQYWERPSDALLGKMRRALNAPSVRVRFQAAVALGRLADASSLEPLAGKLGDQSKMVERGAAWAIRQIASRRPEARGAVIAQLRASMNSADERTRWGAARIFNQHFKYISEEWELGKELLRMAASDPVPAIRMSAVQALYQWWYWDRDTAHKAAIEQALIAGLGRDEHPWVRRNFIEAYYNVLDDNVRYLYGSWIPRVKLAEDRKTITDAHREHVRLQAVRYRDAMKSGNTLTRDGLLRALSTHHIREGLGDVKPLAAATLPETIAGPWVNGYKWAALYDPLTGGTGNVASIGNDSEGPSFYADSSPLIDEALLTALEDGSPPLLLQTLRTLKFLRTFRMSAPLAVRILALIDKAPAEAIAAATAVLPEAPLTDAAVREAVKSAIGRTGVEERAFPLLTGLVGRMPELRRDEAVIARVMAGLASRRPQPQQAVLRLVLGDPKILDIPAALTAWQGFPEQRGSIVIGGSLTVIESLDFRDPRQKAALPEVRRMIMAGLNDPVSTIRTQALNTLHGIEAFASDAEIAARVAVLRRDADPKTRVAALAIESAKTLRTAPSTGAAQLLDYFYFKENVEPILIAKGADGFACANCHANHTLMKLTEPDEFGVVNSAQSQVNYRAALTMVNVRDPENSLLLNKPMSPLDDEGIGDSQALAHGGGIRWTEKRNSPQYQAILRWIRGARLESRAGE